MHSLENGMNPNPTALRSPVKEQDVDRHRNVCCAAYDDCLDAALRRAWRSWSCGQCRLFAFARAARAAESVRVAELRQVA
jgi:hypothetical protein